AAGEASGGAGAEAEERELKESKPLSDKILISLAGKKHCVSAIVRCRDRRGSRMTSSRFGILLQG
ncbi:MAG: hypothetical protein ACKPB4_14940, partial [Sphaerospermopsis kisseleviana]